jgi:hypothetical protein
MKASLNECIYAYKKRRIERPAFFARANGLCKDGEVSAHRDRTWLGMTLSATRVSVRADPYVMRLDVRNDGADHLLRESQQCSFLLAPVFVVIVGSLCRVQGACASCGNKTHMQ